MTAPWPSCAVTVTSVADTGKMCRMLLPQKQLAEKVVGMLMVTRAILRTPDMPYLFLFCFVLVSGYTEYCSENLGDIRLSSDSLMSSSIK